VSMQALSYVFEDRIISSGIRLARSADLNPCDFLFWGCLKDKVYNSNPRKEEELEENVRKRIANIPAEQLQRVNQNLFHRFEGCLLVRVQRQHFRRHLWSVNCRYFIPIVIGHQSYWFIGKTRMHLAARGEPVAVKRRAMNQSTKITSL
jgi:hypothetical protein